MKKMSAVVDTQGHGQGDQGQSQQQQQQQQGPQQHHQLQLHHQQTEGSPQQGQQGPGCGGGQGQMQQLQVIQQPLQNQTYLQQLYNAQGQPQLIMQPGNIAFNPQLNPQIQVLKYFNPRVSQVQVIQPQVTQAQLPQGLTWAPSPFLQNQQFIIRGPQPDQQPMFIQQQQPIHGGTGQHQQFTMPLTATGQLPTTATSNGLQITQQQTGQQTSQTGVQSGVQVSVQQTQSQSIQPANVSVMSMTPIKAAGQATLQPKPQPLQIQPSPTVPSQSQPQQTTHHPQLQNVNVTMGMGGQQFQMTIPHSQSNVLPQHIFAQTPQGQTIALPQTGHQNQQSQPRHLTILPQQATSQPQVTFIQQPPQQQQPQAIRPNFTVTAASNQVMSQGGTPTTATAPQPRQKIRKPGVGRGAAHHVPNAQSPNQGNKVMYPRPTVPNAVGGHGQNQNASKIAIATTSAGGTISRGAPQQLNASLQPLKTINMSAIQHPTLPDATLTPLIPHSSPQVTTLIQHPPQTVQLFTTTQMPTPNISITPAPPPHQPIRPKEEPTATTDNVTETKRETEKENAKLKSVITIEDGEDSKQKLPKALVKPQAQILTHVIEGFVIQEASEPFPPIHRNGDLDEPPAKKMAMSAEMGKCEMCGKIDLKSKFKKNKRFCSSACAKGMKAQQNQQKVNQSPAVNNSKSKNKKWNGETTDGDLTDETSSSVGETCASPRLDHHNIDLNLPTNPLKWSVDDVVKFVEYYLEGKEKEVAEKFAAQEIDGQALMLLKDEHLMMIIGMKLGPALKLFRKIDDLRTACGAGALSDPNNASKA